MDEKMVEINTVKFVGCGWMLDRWKCCSFERLKV